MARRPRPWAPEDDPQERCPYCLARYKAFRAGWDQDDATPALECGGGYGVRGGVTRGALQSEDDARHLNRGIAMKQAGAFKRALWETMHADGRCHPAIHATLERARDRGPTDRGWTLREWIAEFTLDEEIDGEEDGDATFDPSSFDCVPVPVTDDDTTWQESPCVRSI